MLKSMCRCYILIIFCFILLSITLFSVSAADVGNDAEKIAVITNCKVLADKTTNASVNVLSDTEAELNAEFSVPGDSAVFQLNIKNMSNETARLIKIDKNIDTSENIKLSSEFMPDSTKNVLKSGEECTVNIVLQLNPDYSKNNISETGTFKLDFVYEAEQTNEQNSENILDNNYIKTGAAAAAAVILIIICAAALFVIYRNRHKKI